MTIMLRNPDEVIKLPIKFSGHADDAELDVELAVPLGKLNCSMHIVNCY